MAILWVKTYCAVGEALHFVAIITHKKEAVKYFKWVFEKIFEK